MVPRTMCSHISGRAEKSISSNTTRFGHQDTFGLFFHILNGQNNYLHLQKKYNNNSHASSSTQVIHQIIWLGLILLLNKRHLMNLIGGSFVFFRFLSVNAGNCLQLCPSQTCVQSPFKMDKKTKKKINKHDWDGMFHWIKSCSFKNTASVFFNIFPHVLGEGSSARTYGGGDILRMFYGYLIYSSFWVPFLCPAACYSCLELFSRGR